MSAQCSLNPVLSKVLAVSCHLGEQRLSQVHSVIHINHKSYKCDRIVCLVLNTSGGVAKDALVENREDAATSALSNCGADLREVVGIGGNIRS